TCHVFRCIASRRHLWENALVQACRKNQIFEPSFHPMESIPLRDVQRLALHPWRWHNRQGARLVVPSDNTRTSSLTLEPHPGALLRRASETGEPFFSPFLIPGGRYLIAAQRSAIGIWDLGYPGRPL
ncbi:hypothetical protein DFP72DRAFT_752341, partial [Ephemerocybe angulata]